MREIKESINKWGDISCLQIRKLNIITISIFPNMIYRFHTIPVKISASYLVDINKLVSNFIGKAKDPEHSTQY